MANYNIREHFLKVSLDTYIYFVLLLSFKIEFISWPVKACVMVFLFLFLVVSPHGLLVRGEGFGVEFLEFFFWVLSVSFDRKEPV